MNKILLSFTIGLLLYVPPILAQTASDQEGTPGSREYFVKYIEGRYAFTNGQMALMRPVYPQCSILIKGKVVQVIDTNKVLVAAIDEDSLAGYASICPRILLTDNASTYSEGQRVTVWGLSEQTDFACTTEDGLTNTIEGYRTPVPGAITFEQYQQVFDAGMQTPDRVRKVVTCTLLPPRKKQQLIPRMLSYQASIQASADRATAWELATTPDKTRQDGAKAVSLATNAIAALPDSKEALETLAAAYARNGEFEKAIETQKKTIEIVTKENQAGAKWNLQAHQERLELYGRKQPYTRPAPPTAPSTMTGPSLPERVQRMTQREQRLAELKQMTVDQLRQRLSESENKMAVCQTRCDGANRTYWEIEAKYRQATGSDKDALVTRYENAKAVRDNAQKDRSTLDQEKNDIEQAYLVAVKAQKNSTNEVLQTSGMSTSQQNAVTVPLSPQSDQSNKVSEIHQLTPSQQAAQQRDELARLSPDALRERLLTLEAEKRAAYDKSGKALSDYLSAEKVLEKAEGAEKDRALVAYHQAKVKYQQASAESNRAIEAMESARTLLAKSLTNAVPVVPPSEINKVP